MKRQTPAVNAGHRGDPAGSPTETQLDATVYGFPRIGAHRELKLATESYWAGAVSAAGLRETAAQLRQRHWELMTKAGLTSVPCNDFSFYDSMLDTAVMLGAVPPRHRLPTDFEGDRELAEYFAMARGKAGAEPLEMTKWFDTNYHYLVPEIDEQTVFTLDLTKQLGELREVQALGLSARPVLIGPATFLLLSKASTAASAGFDPASRMPELAVLYVDAIGQLNRAGAAWVQLDEPVLCEDLGEDVLAQIAQVYSQIGSSSPRPELLVTSYFGNVGTAITVLRDMPVEAIGLDFTGEGTANTGLIAAAGGLPGKQLLAGVVDGRNIWSTDLRAAAGLLAELSPLADRVGVTASCSLLHVPVDLRTETGLDPEVSGWLAFAVQKLDEIVTLSVAQLHGVDGVGREFVESDGVASDRRSSQRTSNIGVRDRLASLPGDHRAPYADRRSAQQSRLGLPVMPTTTIGSFPQTDEVRSARARMRDGAITGGEYETLMREQIAAVVELQLELGIDVLVHGEPERNDMVQYFAEQLEGFATTSNGWVQSYGTRCVRPPILFGDVMRPAPMTVTWSSYAQSLTAKPVKGMLTGPVTILCWSFVRDDQPLADTARQVALAIRDEVQDLEAAGIAVIQVDEPALREGLPLRQDKRPSYLAWAVEAFRLATSGVRSDTAIHTHMCYADFADVLPAIVDMDVDVISFEAARSGMEIAEELAGVQFGAGVGPGVWDIHSPRVPDSAEMAAKLERILRSLPATQVWVNPDCGLKTRSSGEVREALTAMISAAEYARSRALTT